MITYVNSKEAKLFEMAAEDLGLQSLDVEQYLNKLGELKAISPKYVRLPLYEEGHEDEEVFEIDANARLIQIPASFKKNGVGVVSDQFAEILWFKINRYFDIKDFGKASDAEVLNDGDLHILIQWEAPDGAKGASFAYAIDKDTDPDYVYFGWAITADHLTAKAGNIKFAVRIMQYDIDQKIGYSFATQAAAVAVKANLSFDLTDEDVVIENVADKIASRIMGGQVAYCPIFEQDLPAWILNLEDYENNTAILSVETKAPQEPNPETGELEDVEYDAVAYKWYKKGPEDEEFSQIRDEYKPALSVTSSGQYYVVVFGMREIVDNNEFIYDEENDSVAEGKFKYHTSVASSKSIVCEIPTPKALEITQEMAEKLILGDDAELMLLIKRQMIGQDIVGNIELEISKTATAEKGLDLETAEFSSVGEPSEGSAAVAEYWEYDGNSYETEAAAREACDADAAESGDMADYSMIIHHEGQAAVPARGGVSYEVNDGVITIDMSEAEEGYYKVVVINKLNGDQKETLSSVTCRVVKPAEIVPYDAAAEDCTKVVLLTRSGNESSRVEGSVRDGNQIQAHYVIEGLSDEVEIKWYEASGDQDPDDPRELEDILIEGATDEIFAPEHPGTYYFIAINKVEETSAEARSNVVVFTA